MHVYSFSKINEGKEPPQLSKNFSKAAITLNHKSIEERSARYHENFSIHNVGTDNQQIFQFS